MKILLLQFDGKMPNLALMRIAAHHRRDPNCEVELRRVKKESDVQPGLLLSERVRGGEAVKVYGSLIFEKSRPLAECAQRTYSDITLGGTGWDLKTTLEQYSIGESLDYSLYPDFPHSIGYTQRGCRFKCSFCIVNKKEGKNTPVGTIADIYRGAPHPRNVVLLDNDFFGQPAWRDRIAEIQDGNFNVSFNQGVNIRTINDEAAKAIGSVPYYNSHFTQRRIYTAWDNKKDEKRLMKGLHSLVKHGVKPGHIMVYMLIGYWPGETAADWNYRRQKLRDFGAIPYPMPFVRSKAAVAFQDWTIRALDKTIAWEDLAAVDYNMGRCIDKWHASIGNEKRRKEGRVVRSGLLDERGGK